MAAKFKTYHEIASGDVRVELGVKGEKRLVKVSIGEDHNHARIYDMDEAADLSDALDDALDWYDEHPEHWS